MFLKTLEHTIGEELIKYHDFFKKELKTKVPLLNLIIRYLLQTKGKQLRPILVLLSAKLFGSVNHSAYLASTVFEYIHSATLIHDDVVDEADYRRNFWTIRKRWKNKIAVLSGDFLLSRALILAVKHQDFMLLEKISLVVQAMSEGELLQLDKLKHWTLTETMYLKIIEQKTAVLFAACCACGAHAGQQKPEIIEKMWDFGKHLGMAFQMKDDLLDFQAQTGKPIYKDLTEGKITLPLLHALSQVGVFEKFYILRILRKKNKTQKDFHILTFFIQKNKGLEYTAAKITTHLSQAKIILSHFDKNPAQLAFYQLIDFIAERNN